MQIIETRSLIKNFRSTVATQNLSIHVNEGEIYGFLGLNGAGKTTLIRMLLGMIKPDSGKISLFGKQLDSSFKLWNDIGYLVETPYSYPNLSVRENLQIFYDLRHLKAPNLISEILDKLKLEKYKNTKSKFLSLGNQQRLGLAKALMHKPKLLILDEPINGLDPEGIVEVRLLLQELVEKGSTVFLSSHILGEISKIATRIGIIHEGLLVKEVTTADLSNQLTKKLIVVTDHKIPTLELIKENYGEVVINVAGEIEILDEHAINHPERLTQILVEGQLSPKQVYLLIEDLEMYFLRTIRPNQ